jgi:hypothetical protein
MSVGFWPVVAIIVFVIVWVISKVIFYVKKSEKQWQAIDKSKLNRWEDDEG